MDGTYSSGWYDHPSLGLIKIFEAEKGWVYVCYSANGLKPLARPKPLDPWTWALAKANSSVLG